ncbi:SDR family oxidoreductase [Pseudogemmobacter sonorensis]|uniref:SDR family oxidoreductase n=1 Tax=Pseudogemmobacter sonorensis TaxID=2989681 RepID=UPI00367BA783
MKTLLSLGHGYSAAALARRLIPQGWRVIGTTRDPARAGGLRAAGVEPLLWPADPGLADPGTTDLGAALAQATHVLASAAPVGGRDPFLAALPGIASARAEWVGYLSTTGVYGNRDGAWVDETTPPAPARGRSGDRVEAEAEWLQSGLPVHVFRLAGIYGPGRGPFQKVKDGTARRILKEGQLFSRIHVEDIAQVLEASIRRPDPGAIYNLCDDEPAPADVVLSHAAALLGLPAPPSVRFEEADLPPMARSFYEESRRVRNDRIKRDLGVSLLYPSYREGLAAILAAERAA